MQNGSLPDILHLMIFNRQLDFFNGNASLTNSVFTVATEEN